MTPEASLRVACRAGALVCLVASWFDGGLFKLATASVFWILLELGGSEMGVGSWKMGKAKRKAESERGNWPQRGTKGTKKGKKIGQRNNLTSPWPSPLLPGAERESSAFHPIFSICFFVLFAPIRGKISAYLFASVKVMSSETEKQKIVQKGC